MILKQHPAKHSRPRFKKLCLFGIAILQPIFRIPFIIKTPHISRGNHEERFQHTDIYPTILDILGLDAPYQLDGLSLLRHPESNRTLYFEEKANGNELKALLDYEKKLIYNRMVNKELSDEHLPFFELYALDDVYEKHILELHGAADELRVQQLLDYVHRTGLFDLAQSKIELSPELERKLRDCRLCTLGILQNNCSSFIFFIERFPVNHIHGLRLKI